MIFQSGAKIFSEFSDVRGNHRPMIVYSRIGTVVLERKEVEGKVCIQLLPRLGEQALVVHKLVQCHKKTKAPNNFRCFV